MSRSQKLCVWSAVLLLIPVLLIESAFEGNMGSVLFGSAMFIGGIAFGLKAMSVSNAGR